MTKLRLIPLAFVASALLCSVALIGSPASSVAQTPSARPEVRITAPIDESQLVTLRGNTHPAANSRNDQGPVSPDLRMTDLILVLSRSPQQQAAFEAFVKSQYDETSPNFHQWLTPDQVGAQFGASPTDIATITGWLASHGLTVNEVTKDQMTIRFSGSASQVQSAFHTEIHNLSVNGKPHIANMTDPQIPAALAPAIVGVKALHDFFPRPAHHLGASVTRDAATGKWQRLTSAAPSASTSDSPTLAGKSLTSTRPSAAKPQYPISVSGSTPYLVEDVDPWDFAQIYNVLPMWNGTTAAGVIDGTGQTIAIAGTSDIDIGQASGTESATGQSGANGNNDVATFRTYFGLPTGNAANTPKHVSGNSQPLTVCTDTTGNYPYPANPCTTDDLTENSLDVEWSGSVAKNAQIVLVSSYPASVTDDNLYDSESYIVNNITNASSPVYGAHIMNVSYGECELSNGTAGNVEYYDLWQQASAEGISVFVAAGDSGSASCDDGGLIAESGLTVSGLASTPWNTAVGGTDFNWCNPDTADGTANTECTVGSYWSTNAYASTGSSQQVTSAMGYVPEVPWNESCANPLTLAWSQDIANHFLPSYGYASGQVTNVEQACNFIADFYFYEDEYGDYGLGYYDPYYAYLLQVVGGSGGASNCVAGSAVTNSETGEMTGCTTGATSTGPTTSPDPPYGSQASLTLFNNGWPKPTWQQSSTNNITGLTSDGVRDLPDVSLFASDGFVSSSAYLICVSALDPSNASCTYSTRSEPYYQEVGGTSVATPSMAGVMALINQKTGTPQGFANPELYSLAAVQSSHGYGACSAESVTASSGTCMFNDVDEYTNAQPCDAGVYDGVTTPNCVATQKTLGYADSGEGIGILTGSSATTGYDLATGLGSVNVANLVTGWVSVIGSGATTVTVTPASGTVSLGASLNVTVTVAKSPAGGTPTPTGSVTLSGGGYTSASEALTAGSYMFTIPAGDLSGGSVTLTANYSGDSNYAASSGTAGVTVTKLTPTVNAPSPASLGTIESNAQLVVSGTVTGTGATPTGTVTVSYGTSYTSLPTSLVSGQYSIAITPNSLPGGTPSQNDALTVNYSGDTNYNPASANTSVNVIFFQVLTPTITILPASLATTAVDSGSPLLVTVSVSGSGATPTGNVTLSGSGYTLTSAALGGTSCPTPAAGVACFPIPANTLSPAPSLPAGDPITASYLGDPDYAQASTTTNLTVTKSAFTISATSPGSSVAPGSPATSTVSVASTTDYTGAVTFTSASCVLTSSVPSNPVSPPTCALTGSGAVTVTDGTAGSTVTYTVSSTSTTTASVSEKPAIGPGAPRTDSTGWFGAAGGAAFAALLLLFIPGGARKWSKMLGAILLIVALTFAIAGCGGGSSGGTTTPTLPTPTVTVTPQSSSVSINAALPVSVSVSGTAGTATGGITLTGGAYNSGANEGTLTNGSASFTIPANTFPATEVGSVLLTASYGGSTAYNPATGTATITVNNVPTSAGTYTFTVTPTSNPSVAASTTFTVQVN